MRRLVTIFLSIALVGLALAGCASAPKVDKKREAIARMQMAVTYLEQQNLPMAMRELSSASDLDPENPEIDLVNGVAYMRRGDLVIAEKHFRNALSKRPDYPDAHNNLGRVFSLSGRGDDAIREFQAAASNVYYTTPEYPFLNMGLEFERQGNAGKAEEAYRRAVALNQFFVGAVIQLANLQEGQGRVDDAVATMRVFLRSVPGSTVGLFRLGLILKKAGRKAEAIESFNLILASGDVGEFREKAMEEVNALTVGKGGR